MPRLKLTATNVPGLKPHGACTDYRDTLLPGLVLRVMPRVRTWVVEYHETIDGRRRGRRRKLGHFPLMELGQAREAARAVLIALDRGQGAPAVPGAPVTVAGLVERCLADLTLRPSTRRSWEGFLAAEIIPSIGNLPADQMTRGQVREWSRAIKVRSGWTAKHAFELLRRAYSWGITEELVAASPCDHMPLPFKGEASERVLSAEELWALLRALDRARSPHGKGAAREAYADATRLLLLTGVRRAAILGMRRGELEGLDGPEPRWVVPGGLEGRSKSLRAHVVPLVPAALEVVRRRLELVTGQHLFPVGRERAGDDAPMTWAGRWPVWLKVRVNRTVNARRRADHQALEPVPRWKIHGLRHSMATHMREDLGVTRDIVALLLGHTLGGPRVTGVYDRAERLPERRAALAAWACWLDTLQGGEGARVLPFQKR